MIFERMARNFQAAAQEYGEGHKSKHWNVFPEDFLSVINQHDLWPDCRSNRIAAGMGGNAKRLPHFDSYAIDRYNKISAICGREFLRKTIEGDIGNPFSTKIEGVSVNHHDVLLCYNAFRLFNLVEALCISKDQIHIVDIGGGFGGFALKLKRLFPKAKIVIVDLPETNAIQTYYLATTMPDSKVVGHTEFTSVSDDFDFAILPSWRMSELPDGWADVVINMRAFQEINLEIIEWYIGEIQRTIRVGGLFYCVNRYMKATIGRNNRIKDYPFDTKWAFPISEPLYIQEHEHELACLRLPVATASLSNLRPYIFSEVVQSFRLALSHLCYFIFSRENDIELGLVWKAFERIKAPLRPLKRKLFGPR